MLDQQPIAVRCQRDGDDWRCVVKVGADPDATRHLVTVRADDVARLAPGEPTVDRLVHASFVFLLEREPRESILRAFEISVISRYFPDYQREIRRRLGG